MALDVQTTHNQPTQPLLPASIPYSCTHRQLCFTVSKRDPAYRRLTGDRFLRTRKMANLVSFQAILFPSDDRTPHLVALATSPINTSGVSTVAEPFRCGRMPHPEVFMDYIAEGLGPQSWAYRVRL